MSQIRPLPYRKAIKILRKLGFVFRRATGGSHEIWWHEQKRKTCVVPHHKEVKDTKPSLLLLDYHLPDMTGLELYDRLHTKKNLATTPAIMLSAHLPMKEVAKRKMVGMHKPVELEDLLTMIVQLIA